MMNYRPSANRFQRMIDFFKRLRLPSRVIFITLGILSTIWFLIRVIPKPSRATYPCVRATTPWASAFVIYLLSLSGTVFSLKKFRFHLKTKHIPLAALFFVIALGFSFISLTNSSFRAFSADPPPLETPNSPMGEAKGIFPGRVVWAYNPDATNINCTNNWGDGYWLETNTDQEVVDEMVEDVVKRLTEETTLTGAWDAVFRHYNQQRGKGDVGYQAGEIVFIKTNATSSWGGNFATSDLSRVNNTNFAISETSPQLVTSVLRNLVNVVGVAQEDIYVGDPMKHIYKDNYEKWHGEFPDVHYLDVSYSTLGRERVSPSSTAVIDYSDRGAFLREGDWSSALTGDPIHTDNLYTIFEEMEYMINLPTMKGHERGGVTMFAKNHFGSHTRSDAKHLHGGLTDIGLDSLRNQYGMYRVLVDIMGHELLGNKNLLYLMDALYSSEMEVNKPDKFQKAPWNNDWSSSILASQDPVAIESVGFDILYYEFDGTNGLDAYPHFGAVDDYLHQAADSVNWPEGIVYDPENDGTPLGSLGVHEHWNNPVDMQYSRNLGTGEGIELVKLFPTTIPPVITAESTELPSNQVNTVYVDSSLTVWIGTDAGLSRLTENGWKHYDSILLNSMVNDIEYELTQYGKEIWVATDSGLTVAAYNDVDGVTGSTTYIPGNSGLTGSRIAAVEVDDDHNRWIATDSALAIFRGNQWDSITAATDANGNEFNFSDFRISDIGIMDARDWALISTYGKGILRMSFDPVDGFTGASTYGSPWSSINTDSITAVGVVDTMQWYGTVLGAYYHPSTETKSDWFLYDVSSGLPANYVNTVAIDADENTWIGTNSGIAIIVPDGSMFNYTESDGLVNNQVNYITTDIENKVWVATNGGLQWLDGLTGQQVAMGIPNPVSPADDAGNQELSVTLTWTLVTGATGYEVQVATDDGFGNMVAEEEVLTASLAISDLNETTTYFWRVRAINSSLTGNWSSTFGFTTREVEDPDDLDTEVGSPISLYPVPFNNYLVVEGIGNLSPAAISIYSLDGKLLQQQVADSRSVRINTSHLNNGVFILRVTGNGKVFSFRIVK